MKMLSLNKQKHNEPEFDELYRMLSDLKSFLDEDMIFNENLDIILDFQDDDGSFKFFDSCKIPNDAVIDFCFMPTYLCTAILMKAYLTDSEHFTSKGKSGLLKGLEKSCDINLCGHGFEALSGQIYALNIFMKAGLKEFLDIHSDICPKFSDMIKRIISQYRDMESKGKFFGSWGESYESEIKQINEYFSQRKVFVYGTLMTGEANHHYLESSLYLGPATIEGYEMYDVGWYPAIIPGDNLIIGELYQVPEKDMSYIDMLEGEGSLYLKKCEIVTDAEGKTTFALVYVYMKDCSKFKRISSWKEYVWYVSYGSNMLKERFMHYIEGGYFENCYREPCDDSTPPVAVITLEIPYDMYFGNESISWNGGGVSFIDTTKKGKALAVAYLISRDQFEHIISQENSGRYPQDGYNWYENIIDLGMMDGFEVKTITNRILRPYNDPCNAYWDTLVKGIKENWPQMSDEDIKSYLINCIR